MKKIIRLSNFTIALIFISLSTTHKESTDTSFLNFNLVVQKVQALQIASCYTSAEYYQGSYRVMNGEACYNKNNEQCGREQDCMPWEGYSSCYKLLCN